MHKLVMSPRANNDLLEISNYISNELSSPIAATNTVRKIIKSIKVLELFPLSGTKLDDALSINTDIRYVNSNNYMAFYRFIDDTIYVDRVIYGKRDYIRILFFE